MQRKYELPQMFFKESDRDKNTETMIGDYCINVSKDEVRVEEGQQEQQVGQALTSHCCNIKPAHHFNEQSLLTLQ